MSAVYQNEAPRAEMAPNRTRYHAHTDNLMLVVIDFNDGPHAEPDAPHHHPHEQVSYLVEGELIFFVDGEGHHLRPGDMVAVPGNVPHCVQLLTEHARLIDSFTPLREEFLKKE